MKGKLVRDRIPDIIEANDNRKPRTKKLSPKAFKFELRKKLLEEASEAVRAKTPKVLAEELADVEEVVNALCKVYNIKRSTVTKIQKSKRAKRGGFAKRVFLIN